MWAAGDLEPRRRISSIMFSILHISDLHRSADDPISNDTLVAALLADRDRYALETPEIPCPNAIVVSGDLVHGAALGIDYRAEIEQQYEVSHNLLAKLADRLLEGDRSRVVIVPGNHDCCWNTAMSAMRIVTPESEPTNIESVLLAPGSTYRWSWNERRLYSIGDTEQYRGRFDAYWDFVERFYKGANLVRPIDRTRGFNLFDLDDGRIVVAAFESLHGNDCFSARGAIADGTVARCGLALRDSGSRHRLRVAVWHHSIYGPPERTDYMDVTALHEMIGMGFRLGMHGHQHYAQTAVQYLHQPHAELAVVSTGSLCAGGGELPRGIDRQYNVVVINDEYNGARVHVREMGLGNQFARTHRGGFGLDGVVNLKWTLPADMMGRPIDHSSKADAEAIEEAEAAIRAGDGDGAIRALTQTDRPAGSYARRLVLKAAQMTNRWDLVVSEITNPETADELILLVRALEQRKEVGQARAALASHSDRVGLPLTMHRDLEERLDVQEMMGLHS